MVSVGVLVVSDDFEHMFKISEIKNGNVLGFDILNYSKLVSIPTKRVLPINNSTFFKKILTSNYVKHELSDIFHKTILGKSVFLGVSDRTVHRIIESSENEFNQNKTLLKIENPDQN